MADDSKCEWGFEARDYYLYCWLRGTFTSEEQMLRYQRAIEAEMKPEQFRRRIMIDNREADPAPEHLRAAMWTWLSVTKSIRRMALVANSAKITRRTDRTADRNRLTIRGFNTIEEAEAWLVPPDRETSSGEREKT
ncbi:MAG: STAS/SEC14 domain-containing protein [Myxococcota bacterium]